MKIENKSSLIRTGSLNSKCSKNTFPLNNRDEHQQSTAPSEAARMVFLARKSETWSFRYANGIHQMTYTMRADLRCFRFAFQLRSSDFRTKDQLCNHVVSGLPPMVFCTGYGHDWLQEKCQMVAAVSHAKGIYLTSDGFYGHFRLQV